MKPYNEKELSQSVYYPACGFDFSPLLAFSHISQLFIYADWGVRLEEVARKVEQYCEQVSNRLAPDGLKLVETGLRVDVGLNRGLRQPRPESLEDLPSVVNGLLSTNELVAPRETTLPGNFALNLDEQNAFIQKAPCFMPRVREFTLEKTIGNSKRNIKLLYVVAEGLATYCACYQSGKIAPKILVTVQSGGGLGGGYVTLEDPRGIMARFLCECERKPLLWVRGGLLGPHPGPLPENPRDGLYNKCVRYYRGWNEAVAAFALSDSHIPNGFLVNEWSEREDFADLLEISVF